MTPQEYVADLKLHGFRTELVDHVLAVKEKLEARGVLEAGYDLIGRKLGELFDEMTPKAVEHIRILEQFLLVFIEHVMNPALVRNVERKVESGE
jgi:hypothetical protein